MAGLVLSDVTISHRISSHDRRKFLSNISGGEGREGKQFSPDYFPVKFQRARCCDERGDNVSRHQSPLADDPALLQCEYLGADPGASRSQGERQPRFSSPGYARGLGGILGFFTGTQAGPEGG